MLKKIDLRHVRSLYRIAIFQHLVIVYLNWSLEEREIPKPSDSWLSDLEVVNFCLASTATLKILALPLPHSASSWDKPKKHKIWKTDIFWSQETEAVTSLLLDPSKRGPILVLLLLCHCIKSFLCVVWASSLHPQMWSPRKSVRFSSTYFLS